MHICNVDLLICKVRKKAENDTMSWNLNVLFIICSCTMKKITFLFVNWSAGSSFIRSIPGTDLAYTRGSKGAITFLTKNMKGLIWGLVIDLKVNKKSHVRKKEKEVCLLLHVDNRLTILIRWNKNVKECMYIVRYQCHIFSISSADLCYWLHGILGNIVTHEFNSNLFL